MLLKFKHRLLLLFIAMLFFLGLFQFGYIIKIDNSISKELSKNFINQIRGTNELGIFFNNFKIFITRFGILELISYSLAISKGSIFLYEILKKKISKKSILYLIIEIGLVGIMLFIGALIEWNMIIHMPKRAF